MRKTLRKKRSKQRRMDTWLRIPAEADQHSWTKPITIPV
jgi:hypothetical protein